MGNEQTISFVALATLLAFSMPIMQPRQPHHAAPRLESVLETLADALTCDEADPRLCSIRTLP